MFGVPDVVGDGDNAGGGEDVEATGVGDGIGDDVGAGVGDAVGDAEACMLCGGR